MTSTTPNLIARISYGHEWEDTCTQTYIDDLVYDVRTTIEAGPPHNQAVVMITDSDATQLWIMTVANDKVTMIADLRPQHHRNPSEPWAPMPRELKASYRKEEEEDLF